MSSAPKYDKLGMHARECGCARCEAGFRPTEQQRTNAAVWAMKRGKEAAKVRRQVEIYEQHRAAVAATATALARAGEAPSMSEAELAELRADVERFRQGGKRCGRP